MAATPLLRKSRFDTAVHRRASWSMPPADRSFDPAKVAAFLGRAGVDAEVRAVERALVEHARYVPFAEFHETMLATLIAHLPPRFYLLLQFDKGGSEHWVAALFWDVIAPGCLGIVHHCAELGHDDVPVVRIDDCVYSGQSACGAFDAFTYSASTHRNLRVPNALVSLTAFACNQCERASLRDMGVTTVVAGEWVDGVTALLPGVDEELLINRMGFETLSVAPIYFDHKIAVAHCAPQCYHQLVREPPSRATVKAFADLLGI